jgi:hypothetical protein
LAEKLLPTKPEGNHVYEPAPEAINVLFCSGQAELLETLINSGGAISTATVWLIWQLLMSLLVTVNVLFEFVMN